MVCWTVNSLSCLYALGVSFVALLQIFVGVGFGILSNNYCCFWKYFALLFGAMSMNMNMSNNELCFVIMAHGINKLKTRENLFICSLYVISWHVFMSLAQSVKRLVTNWTVRWSNPGGGEISCARPDRPWGPPSLLYNGYRVSFPGVKRCGIYHPPSSSAEVKESVEIFTSFPSGLSWSDGEFDLLHFICLFVYVCIYIYICVLMYVCMYMYVCVYVYFITLLDRICRHRIMWSLHSSSSEFAVKIFPFTSTAVVGTCRSHQNLFCLLRILRCFTLVALVSASS